MIETVVKVERVKAKALRREHELALANELLSGLKDITVAALGNPTLSMVGAVALTDWLHKKDVILEIDRGLLVGVIASAAVIDAFKPIVVGGR